jgi:hypothetical protein
MRSTCRFVLACLSLVLACAEPVPEDCTDQQPTLEFVNMTGNTVQAIHFYACDQSEQSDYPLPGAGLATGETISISFPGPGCWRIEYEGEACESDQPEQTDELSCDDTFEWVADDINHICIG